MKKLKVCHVVNILSGKADGTYTHIKMLCKVLNKEKYKQYLVFQGNDIVENELKALGVVIIKMPSLDNKISILAFISLYRFFRSENIDIILAHHIKPYIIVGLLNIFLRRKVIFNYNGIFIKSVYRNWFENLLYQIPHFLIQITNSVQVAIVPSSGSKSLLEEETKLFKDIRVYYNGFNFETMLKYVDNVVLEKLKNLRKNHLIVGIVSRLEIQKKLDFALNMVRMIVKGFPNIHFVVMGDGPLEKELRKQSQELNIENYVTFFDFVKNAQIYFTNFDCLLFTSAWEGFPLSIWEAMYYKVPIISSDVGGIKEILEGENCGIIFEYGNLEQAKEALVNLLRNSKIRKSLGENGHNAVINKYNSREFQLFFDNVFNELKT